MSLVSSSLTIRKSSGDKHSLIYCYVKVYLSARVCWGLCSSCVVRAGTVPVHVRLVAVICTFATCIHIACLAFFACKIQCGEIKYVWLLLAIFFSPCCIQITKYINILFQALYLNLSYIFKQIRFFLFIQRSKG